MSGPKSSRYTLTLEQQRILAEQQKKILADQERIVRAKRAANAVIQKNIDSLRRMSEKTSYEAVIVEEALARLGNDGGYTRKLEEIHSFLQEAESIVFRIDHNDLDSFESAAKFSTGQVKRAEQLREEIQDIILITEQKLRIDINETLQKGSSVSFSDLLITNSDTATRLQQQKTEIIEKIVFIKNSSILSRELLKELERITLLTKDIDNEQLLKYHIALVVSPLLKQCASYSEIYQKHYDEYETLYSQYVALCELYHYDVQEVPFSAEAIDYLKSEIEKINKAAQQQEEHKYIQNSIDEVMAEMGYSVIGSREVTKRNGNHFRNELYTYGDGTAVNVTYSSDGRIVMELGGLDSKDRTPDEYECAVLCEEMQDFCKDFKEIEKRLLERGVILASRISLFPPDKAYAQIINTADYDMKTDTDRFTAEKQRKKAAKKKTMKAE